VRSSAFLVAARPGAAPVAVAEGGVEARVARRLRRRQPRLDDDALRGVLRAQVAGDAAQAVHRRALSVREQQAHGSQGAVEEGGDPGAELVEPLPRRRRDVSGVRVRRFEAGAPRRVVQQVGLVEDEDPRRVRADHVEHVGDRLLARRDLVHLEACVGHDEDDVGDRRLFQRRGERIDELVRQLADEPDRVGDDVIAVAVAEGARRRVEGLEQAVGDGDVRVGERVQERGLARVRVPGEGDERDGTAQATSALRAPRPGHALDALSEHLDAPADDAAVDFELRLAGTAHVDAGAEAREHKAFAAHARELVFELRQMDLQGPLERVGVLREDAEDELGPVEDVGVDGVEHCSDLTRREVVLADRDRRARRLHRRLELGHLAAAQVCMRVGPIAMLDDIGEPLDVRRAQKLLDLGQMLVVRGRVRLAAGQHGEHDGARRTDGGGSVGHDLVRVGPPVLRAAPPTGARARRCAGRPRAGERRAP